VKIEHVSTGFPLGSFQVSLTQRSEKLTSIDFKTIRLLRLANLLPFIKSVGIRHLRNFNAKCGPSERMRSNSCYF